MKLKKDYFYRREKKTRFSDIERVCNDIITGRHRKVIESYRELVYQSVANNNIVCDGDEMLLPKTYWSISDSGYNGMVMLSLTFGDNKRKLNELRNTLGCLQQVRCMFVGASGRTLNVVMAYTLTDGSLPTETGDVSMFHAAAHQSASRFAEQLTGIRAEARDKDWTLGTPMSCDADLYYNANASSVPMAMPTMMPQEKTEMGTVAEYDENELPDYSELEMEVTKFNLACRRVRMESGKSLSDSILPLAAECRRCGIREEVAVKCTLCLNGMHEKELLVRTSFENVYKDKQMGHKSMLSKVLMQQILLRDFLAKRYLFRRNIITDSVEYMERSKYVTSWKPLTPSVQNTICLAAQMAGIEAWDKDLARFINSSLVTDFDPIADWLRSLPQWDGTDRVAALAGMVETDSGMWKHDLHVWLRSMVSQWMNRGNLYGASMVLMLIGAQGTRKSTFCKMLMPNELLTYYNDRIDFVNKREAERALMRFALICMDEFDQITKSQTAYLKHIIQKSDIKWRKMYQDDIEQRRRYAAFCATTNSPTPLTDPTGSRRFLCVEVRNVIDTSTAIDHQQLYAQILSEIRRGEPTYFSSEDEHRIQEQNKRYYQEQPLEVFVSKMFAIPEDDDEGEWMSALDVAKEMHSAVRAVRCDMPTVINIGKLLTQKNFPRKHVASGNIYRVKTMIGG